MSIHSELDKELASYIYQLNTKQKQAVLTVVKTFVEPNVWDENLVREFDRRASDYETGGRALLTLEEIEEQTRNAFKNR